MECLSTTFSLLLCYMCVYTEDGKASKKIGKQAIAQSHLVYFRDEHHTKFQINIKFHFENFGHMREMIKSPQLYSLG